MAKSSKSFEVFKGKVRRQIDLLKNKAVYINLLSVSEMILCEKYSRILISELVNEGFEQNKAVMLAENACLGWMCLTDCDSCRIFENTTKLMSALTSEDMLFVAKVYKSLRRDYLGFDVLNDSEFERIKNKLSSPLERIRWEILKKFNKLPNDPIAQSMTELDYLYCYTHIILDDEKSWQECAFNNNFNIDEYKRKCGANCANI